MIYINAKHFVTVKKMKTFKFKSFHFSEFKKHIFPGEFGHLSLFLFRTVNVF